MSSEVRVYYNEEFRAQMILKSDYDTLKAERDEWLGRAKNFEIQKDFFANADLINQKKITALTSKLAEAESAGARLSLDVNNLIQERGALNFKLVVCRGALKRVQHGLELSKGMNVGREYEAANENHYKAIVQALKESE